MGGNVKEGLHIPVVANGDITSGEDALRVLGETGADGIMIGRAAIGNPFVFSEVLMALSGEKFTPPTLQERITTALFQLSVAIEEKGEGVAVREARKQIALYLHSSTSLLCSFSYSASCTTSPFPCSARSC